MLNKKGFLTIEMIFYFVIATILVLLLTTIIIRTSSYQNNEKIKIYQSLDILKKSLIKYRQVSKFSPNEVEFAGYIKLKMRGNDLYETPGYLPYLQGIEKPKFTYQNNILELSFTYQNEKYSQIIFYDK